MMNSKANLGEISDRLGKLIREGKEDPTVWDRMAQRIRDRQADGLIEEAIGYLPDECRTTPEGDAFRPVKYRNKKGERL
jgi:hypothetical protein